MENTQKQNPDSKTCPYDWSKCPVMNNYMSKCPHGQEGSKCPFMNFGDCPYLMKMQDKCPFLAKHVKTTSTKDDEE